MSQLQIASPCHENWNNMSPSERGKFCASCAKEVVDFTQKPKKEIVKFLEEATGSTCGRFKPEQIDHVGGRQLTPAMQKKHNFLLRKIKKLSLGTLAFFGFGLMSTFSVSAQVLHEDYYMVKGKVAAVETIKAMDAQVELSGVITDEHDGTPIEGADVSVLLGERYIAMGFSDAEGKYSFTIDADPKALKEATVVAYASGHKHQLVPLVLDKAKKQIDVALDLQIEYELMGDVAIEIEELEEVNGVIDEEIEVEEVPEVVAISDLTIVQFVETIDVEETPIQEQTGLIEEVVLDLPTPPVELVHDIIQVEELVIETKIIDPEVIEVIDHSEMMLGAVVMIEEELIPEEIVEEEIEIEEANPVEIQVETPLKESFNIDLFPNPSRDFATVAVEESGTYQIAIFDQSGKLVETHQLFGVQLRIPLEKYEAGIYHVRVTAQDNSAVQTAQLVVGK